MNLARYACHGLGILQPIDMLVHDLGGDWNVVGGMNPHLEEVAIENRIKEDVAAGKDIVWIGHSMGAALGFYIPQLRNWKFRLIITVDPMCWASNIDCYEWQTDPPQPGRWRAEGN